MKQSLKVLTDRLPPMPCDRGCRDCCGPVAASDREIRRILAYIEAHGIEPTRPPEMNHGVPVCPFFQEGRCAVYPVRPFVCRLFGHSPGLVCSRGYNHNIAPGTEKKMLRLYEKQGPRRQLTYVFGGLAVEVAWS